MNKEEIKEKMNELSNTMKDFNGKIKDVTDTVVIAGMISKDDVDKKLIEAKGDLAATQENFRIISEKSKSKISSELLKNQLNFEESKKKIISKRNDLKQDISDKKYQYQKDSLLNSIQDSLDYADICAALAVKYAKESTVSYLEALDKQVEYNELYDNNKKAE